MWFLFLKNLAPIPSVFTLAIAGPLQSGWGLPVHLGEHISTPQIAFSGRSAEFPGRNSSSSAVSACEEGDREVGRADLGRTYTDIKGGVSRAKEIVKELL